MITRQDKPVPFRFLPFVVLFIALCYLASLLYTIKEDVFFSGDAGLKFLVVRQISKGGSFYTLQLGSPLWVQQIWSQGFYPFKSPFVYDSPEGKIISFPPAYQWLNGCFYKWFGYRGIYFIPAISLIGIWTLFLSTLYRAGVKPLVIAIGFIFLALGSPLTIYGAMYWEHTLSVLLLCGALFLLMAKPSVTSAKALLAGAFAGMTVWLRPEMLLFCFLFIIMILYNNFSEKNKTPLVFIYAALTGIALFFVFNKTIYGNILGAHSYQLSNTGGLLKYMSDKFIIFMHINVRLIIFFPAIILLYTLAAGFLFKKSSLPPPMRQLIAIIIVFAVVTPFALPNAGGKQWGPRYFLPIIPLALIALCLATSYIETNYFKKSKWILPLVAVIAYSLYVNVYLAGKHLHDDYAYRVKPGLDFLKREYCDILVIQNQYIAQEFAAVFEKKKIFLAEDQHSFNKLTNLLKDAGISHIMYMAADPKKIMLPHNLVNGVQDLKQVGDYYFAEYNLK